jgi:hypothetical protein
MSYVTGVFYNILCVLLAPLAAVFLGFHVPAAPEPPASLSPDLVCMVTTLMLWPDCFHCGMLHCSYSLQDDDWET